MSWQRVFMRNPKIGPDWTLPGQPQKTVLPFQFERLKQLRYHVLMRRLPGPTFAPR